jgi:hypothetical protein
MKYEALKNNKPTINWINEDEDESFYSEDCINATNETLDIFLRQLDKLGDNSSEGDIMNAVKEVVMSLNELNEQYDFISTFEREDLFEFIDSAVRISGMNPNEDVTEVWRDW